MAETIASVLEEKIGTCVRQLSSLRERINHPLSKDPGHRRRERRKADSLQRVAASPHCSEDQQPCIAILYEVLRAKKRNRVLKRFMPPSHNTPTTSSPLQDLERVVAEAQYAQCKIFVNDLTCGRRTADESLLSSNKEVMDVTLIDDPGLNHDATHAV
ncbi:hypothetical protein EDB81DRAFT_34735 [Dactylonectria macrodidyma]|uniref:Uncharacterized protein n=1 Tax=Dactylonectria macrodidyma TaxID=307937 RepID=A0A9P9JNN3_9HYPO|nr:hypothetical protein EDB81DRAFT_34735 [Dactylonectria macrodidyma]